MDFEEIDMKNVFPLLMANPSDETSTSDCLLHIVKNQSNNRQNNEQTSSVAKQSVNTRNHASKHYYKIFCTICSANFHIAMDYENHWSLNHTETSRSLMYKSSHMCANCGRYFQSSTALRVHCLKCNASGNINNASPTGNAEVPPNHRKILCTICRANFHTALDYKKHWSLNHAEQNRSSMNETSNNVCTNCNRYFQSSTALSVHCLTCNVDNAFPTGNAEVPPNHRKKLLCTICGANFHTAVDYEKHWSLKHADQSRSSMYDTSSYLCTKCNRYFQNFTSLRVHSKKCRHNTNASDLRNSPKIAKHATQFLSSTIANKNVDAGNSSNTPTSDLKSFPIFCTACSDSFDIELDYDDHWTVKHSDKNRALMYSNSKNKKYKQPSLSSKRIKLSKKRGAFLSDSSLLRRNIFCRICSKHFWSAVRYENHWSSDHSDVDKSLLYKNAHLCAMCNRYFENSHALNRHKILCNNNAPTIASTVLYAPAIASTVHRNTDEATKCIEVVSEEPAIAPETSTDNNVCCRVCSENFSTRDAYEAHWWREHASLMHSLNVSLMQTCGGYFENFRNEICTFQTEKDFSISTATDDNGGITLNLHISNDGQAAATTSSWHPDLIATNNDVITVHHSGVSRQ